MANKLKILIIFIFFLFGIVFVSAQLDVGFEEGEPVVEIVQPTVATNYSTVNVNNSQYFQSYTPTTLRNWMQTLFDTLYQSIGSYIERDDNVAWTNETNTFTQPQIFKNITIETKIDSTLNSTVCWKFKENGDIGVSVIC